NAEDQCMAVGEKLDIMGVQPVTLVFRPITQGREGVYDLEALILEAPAGSICSRGKALRRDKSQEHIRRARRHQIGAGVIQDDIIGSASVGAAAADGANQIARSRPTAV